MQIIRQLNYQRLAEVICRWPRAILCLGFGLAVLAGVYTTFRLEFKTSRNDLLGRDSEYWRLFSEYTREFRDEEDYLVVVESSNPQRNREVVDALVKALLSPSNNPHPDDDENAQLFRAEDLFWRVDYEALQNRFLYFLSTNELAEIRSSMGEFKQLVAILEARPELATFFDAMNQMLQQMAVATRERRQRMASFLPTVTAIVDQMAAFRHGASPQSEFLSPWAGAFFSDQAVSEAQQQMQWGGYNVFNKGRTFIVLVHPRPPPGSPPETMAPHSATVPKLRRIISEVQATAPDVRIGLTGEPVLDLDEMEQSQRDAMRATVLTLVLITVLFVSGFREWLRPLLATLCLVLIVSLSMGWATFSVGHLNMITITFAVMILGLSIDLGIQIIARYEEELVKPGAERRAALQAAIVHTGPSILMAATTNAAAFLAMGLSGFKGVIELGIIASGGMVLGMLVMLFVLPSMILVWRRPNERAEIPAHAAASRFDRWLLSRPAVVLVTCCAISIAAVFAAFKVRFDYNVLNLQSRGIESVEIEQRLLRTDAESTLFAAIVCDSVEEARRIQTALEKKTNVVNTVVSIAALLPEDQDRKAQIIREIQQALGRPKLIALPSDVDLAKLDHALRALRLQASRLGRELEKTDPATAEMLVRLAQALLKAREVLAAPDAAAKMRAYQTQFFSDLQKQLDMIGSQVTDRPMTVQDVPREIRSMLVGKSGKKFLVRVFARENIWEREPLVRFVREVQAVAPKATGTPLGIYEFVEILQKGYIKAAGWALLVIVAVIWLDFRNLRTALLTLVPLLTGVVWMLGALGAAGVPFNPANIMTLPLIVGIGVAYGIYVVQRYREDRDARVFGKSTGRAVVLSALTTMVGFGSLMIGKHRGIFTLGLVMSIGVLACLITSLTLLPALLELARRRGWKV
ncbi:MAG: MMPL family transporter [Verrucomicrobiae bacterium]|nr:MMPL family transporter [Verrucomicrobiae bacterium]